MKISEFYKRQKHTISFEFFPPKTEEAEEKLFETAAQLQTLKPSFISVTYGAMGTTRANTLRIVSRIKKECGLEAAAHWTCAGRSAATRRWGKRLTRPGPAVFLTLQI